MARTRQSRSLRQRVEQLVAEGNGVEAYNLLSEAMWIPAGSGYQKRLPKDLKVYANVDSTRMILVSPGKRYWAWEQLPVDNDRAGNYKKFAEEVEGMPLPEIAQELHELGGLVFWTNHDAGDGRLLGDVDKDLGSVRQAMQIARLGFAKKAGIDPLDSKTLNERVREEHQKFADLMVTRWEQIFTLGTVFKITAQGYEKYADQSFETIGAYNTEANSILNEQTVLAVELGTDEIQTFDDQEVIRLRLTPVEAVARHLKDPRILRSPGGGKFSAYINEKPACEMQAVFEFNRARDPRNGTWETFHVYGIPGRRGEGVILACNRHGGSIAEFTADDQIFMNLLNVPQINVVKDRHRHLHF